LMFSYSGSLSDLPRSRVKVISVQDDNIAGYAAGEWSFHPYRFWLGFSAMKSRSRLTVPCLEERVVIEGRCGWGVAGPPRQKGVPPGRTSTGRRPGDTSSTGGNSAMKMALFKSVN